MLNQFHRMWALVEEHQFREELAALHRDPVRADEFVDGAKNTLSRDPQTGTQITDTIWFLPMGIGNIAIYYRFDKNNVYLMSIRAGKKA